MKDLYVVTAADPADGDIIRWVVSGKPAVGALVLKQAGQLDLGDKKVMREWLEAPTRGKANLYGACISIVPAELG